MSSDLLFNYAEIRIVHGNYPSLEKNIQEAEYCCGTIECEDTFLDKLQFMGAPPHWYAYESETPITKEGEIYSSITGTGGYNTVSLRRVAQGIIDEYGDGKPSDSVQMLYRLGMAHEWYKKFMVIGAYFDRRLFTPLWVRNWGDRKSLYVEDGNTRSLNYALRLICKEEEYKPVPFIWCRSWRHVLSWADIYDYDPDADDKYGSPADIIGIDYST